MVFRSNIRHPMKYQQNRTWRGSMALQIQPGNRNVDSSLESTQWLIHFYMKSCDNFIIPIADQTLRFWTRY